MSYLVLNGANIPSGRNLYTSGFPGELDIDLLCELIFIFDHNLNIRISNAQPSHYQWSTPEFIVLHRSRTLLIDKIVAGAR